MVASSLEWDMQRSIQYPDAKCNMGRRGGLQVASQPFGVFQTLPYFPPHNYLVDILVLEQKSWRRIAAEGGGGLVICRYQRVLIGRKWSVTDRR